ncbi:hypothetical protein M5X06_21970 [Paenibacillus alvei]|uniref:Copper amine oxidase-like N-terminal domain-containing protein n=1 Tax=Paenibacillus alvei TaxID=44250 RepID=A0ABT4H3N3_PAEAL|nr:hypothetical protein [Paenibacillus alvei]MCY9763254.1 hypothetical protein [Paenibacillus alvei]MCY9769457.1 hypothetical protein [Paenibacillus alvei]
MRRFILTSLFSTVLINSFMFSAFAADKNEISFTHEPDSIVFKEGKYKGQEIDVITSKGKLYVQAQAMVPFENEFNFDENGTTGKVTIDNVDIWLGAHPEIWKNGKALSKLGYDEALLREGYIPIRFVYEEAGYSVEYADRKVKIYK